MKNRLSHTGDVFGRINFINCGLIAERKVDMGYFSDEAFEKQKSTIIQQK